MNSPHADTILNISRTFDAPRDAVFEAWTDPDQFREWFAPGSLIIPALELDARTGGAYRVEMTDPAAGVTLAVKGTYANVEPPSRLVFTWVIENADGESPATRVAVDFVEEGGQTVVNVVHDLFPDAGMRDYHTGGWNVCMDQLKQLLVRT